MAEFQSIFTGQEVDNTINKLRSWIVVDGTYPTVTISGITYAVIWKSIPVSGKACYGIGLHPTTGRPYEIYYNGSSYTATALDTDTKNTAGATNDTGKLYLVGTKTQDENPQTYSNSQVYMTNGILTTNSISTNTIDSSNTTLALNVNGSTLAEFEGSTDGGTRIITYGYLTVWGDNDSSNPLKPISQASISDLDTHYFNTGITLQDADNETTTYKLSFPAKSGTFATLDDITTGEATNLGYYDTITENSDGTYTITRQTGYLTINKEDITSGSNETVNNANAYAYVYNNNKISDAFYEWEAIIGISNNGFEVKCVDASWVKANKISINSTQKKICLGFETAKTQAEIQALCPIYIQYKLATATTEKVEKNHYSRYNERFILENNKTEAERSANLLNTFDRSNIPTNSSLYAATLNSDGSYTSNASSDSRAWDYGDTDFKLHLTKGTYSFSITGKTISTDSNTGMRVIASNGTTLCTTHSGNGYKSSFTLTSDTDVGVLIKSYTSENLKIMLNKGLVALPYQPYNQNKHITNNEALFLKTEANRSANVFNKDLPTLIYGTGYEVPTTANDWVKVYRVPVKGNTVYSSNKAMKILASSDGSTYNYIGDNLTTFRTESNIKYLCLCIYVGSNATENLSRQKFSDLIINEGPVSLPYQPYEGMVIHEKDLLSASVKTADYFKYGRGVMLADSTSFTNNFNKDIFGETTADKFHLVELRTQGNAPSCLIGNHSSGIAWKGYDTYGSLMVRWGYPQIRVSGGNGTDSNPRWTVDLIHSNNISSESIKYASSGLGCYDTITENSDGTYTINRQTGYILLDGFIEKNASVTQNGSTSTYRYTFDIVNGYGADGPVISNLLTNISFSDLSNNGRTGIAMYSATRCSICIAGITTLADYKSHLAKNNIYIQYKLATAITEKVEKNHYARYNEHFILEHNKSEAERSANLWDEITELGTISGDDGSLENNSARLRSKNFIPISGNTRYIFNSSYIARINFYGSTFNFISTWVNNKTAFVTPSNAYFIKFDINSDYGTTYKNDIILNEGPVSLPYQPYEGKVIHEKDLKNASTSLGYYDTITENADGSYTITKQTGYINGTDFLYWGINAAGNRYVTFDHIKVDKNIENVIGNCGRVGPNDWWQSKFSQVTITYDGNNDFLIILLPYGTAENDATALNDIHIQYKLPNTRTEIVEKNYCAQYNKRFILEHNKREAAKSSNLWSYENNITINAGSESWWYLSNATMKAWGLEVGETYSIKSFVNNNTKDLAFQLLPSYSDFRAGRSFVFTNDTQIRIGGNTVSSSVTFTPKIMLVKGIDIADEYQPYSGETVHKKEFENFKNSMKFIPYVSVVETSSSEDISENGTYFVIPTYPSNASLKLEVRAGHSGTLQTAYFSGGIISVYRNYNSKFQICEVRITYGAGSSASSTYISDSYSPATSSNGILSRITGKCKIYKLI